MSPCVSCPWRSTALTAAAKMGNGRSLRTCYEPAPLQVVEKKEELDWTRHLAFVGFGFFYLGGVQYYLYNKKFVQVQPPCSTTR